MSKGKSSERLLIERKDLITKPIEGVSMEWKLDNLSQAIFHIEAPSDTIYEGDIFSIQMEFDERYPIKRPLTKMLTPIFHPNIDKIGGICLHCVIKGYSPSIKIRQIIDEFIHALKEPGLTDPLNKNAASLYSTDKDEFIRIAKEIVMENIINRNS